MQMIDLVYRFCCSWIFYHILWFWNETESIRILFSLLWPRFFTGIVHSWPVSVIVTIGWPWVSAGGSHVRLFTEPVPGDDTSSRSTSLTDTSTCPLGKAAAGEKSQRCKKNKCLLKNLIGNRGSVYRVWAERKTERRGQQIESKDRLVCLWAVHSRPTPTCVFIAVFWWFLWKEETETERTAECSVEI